MMDVLWKAKRRLLGPGIARNVLGTRHSRNALLLYRVETFRLLDSPITHQNMMQARELARIVSDLGYDVDVLDFDERRRGLLDHDYDLVLDLAPAEAPVYEGRLRSGAVRIAYMTGSNPTFSNAAELTRLADLERRRGVSLAPRRQCAPLARSIESFDGMLYFGNATTLASYAEFRLPPCYAMVNNGYDDVAPTDPARRDPRRFLFLASAGQVLKGLDLLLERFAAEPDLSLVVCSQFGKERDFVAAYRRELFHTPNIQAIGFLDVRSRRFRELQADCGWMILPSCSEGQSGTVTVAMSFGMPCVVSPWCGFDDPDLLVLPDCRPETLSRVTGELASRKREELARCARQSLELARRKYPFARYAATVREALTAILGVRGG